MNSATARRNMKTRRRKNFSIYNIARFSEYYRDAVKAPKLTEIANWAILKKETHPTVIGSASTLLKRKAVQIVCKTTNGFIFSLC